MTKYPIIFKTMGEIYGSAGNKNAQEQAGASAEAWTGYGMSIISNLYNNIVGAKREQDARMQNYLLNERAAQNADTRTRALYHDIYSPEALLKQYKAAGLSPSMMFGGTPGQGGMNGAQGAGANQPSTYMPMSMLEAAQASLALAQTRKTNAEAATEEGSNQRGAAEIANLLKENDLQQAAVDYQEAQTAGMKLDNELKKDTMQFSIERAEHEANIYKWNVDNAMWDSMQKKKDYEFSVDSYNDRIEYVKNDVLNKAADTLLKGAQTELTQEEKSQIKASIAQRWEELRLKGQELGIRKESLEAQKAYWKSQTDQFYKALEQDMEQFNKKLKQGYIQTGVSAVTSIVSGAVGGAVIKGFLGQTGNYIQGQSTTSTW